MACHLPAAARCHLRRTPLRHAAAACLALGLLVAAAARAQTAADLSEAGRNIDRIQREQEERQRIDAQRALEGAGRQGKIVLPPAASASVPASTACVQVREVRIDDAPALPKDARERIEQAAAGRCLSLADIQQVLADVVAAYTRRGLIGARAYIRPQDGRSGVLSVLVVEGQVEKIVLADDGRASINIDTAFPGLVGRPLNLRDLEMGVEQVSRLASNHATMELLPGANAGDTVVSLRNEPSRRWRLNTSVDDEGGDTTGRDEASVGLGFDDLLGLNDLLDVTYRHTVPMSSRASAQSRSLLLIVPDGYDTFTGSMDDSSYVSTLQTASGKSLRSNGVSRSRRLGADRVVYRDQASRVDVSTAVGVKSTNNYLADQFLATTSRTLTVWDLDAGWSQQWDGAVLSFQVGASRGLRAFGALRDAPALPGSAPHAQFRKLRYGATWFQPLNVGGRPLSLTSSLTGQYGVDALYGSEQLLLGGLYSVRGFVNTTLSGDSGLVLRNDLAMPIPVEFSQLRSALFRPYLGIDYGRMLPHGPGSQPGYLSGATLGASLSSGGVAIDLFNAWPLGMSKGLRHEDGRLYLQIRASL